MTVPLFQQIYLMYLLFPFWKFKNIQLEYFNKCSKITRGSDKVDTVMISFPRMKMSYISWHCLNVGGGKFTHVQAEGISLNWHHVQHIHPVPNGLLLRCTVLCSSD